MNNRVLTAEYVRNGHPDKLADIIADSILDECLKQDKDSHVACEVMLAHNKCFISGEITTKAKVDYIEIAKKTIAEIGYDADSVEYETRIHSQSADINQAVSKKELGAGDQGIVYGYATDETLNLMPLPYELAHRICERLDKGNIKGIRPDGKCLVAVKYDGDRFGGIETIVISVQHDESKTLNELESDIKSEIIDRVFDEYDLSGTKILINPSGRFVLGGFEADTGLTGRKLQVDSYGSIAHHGGGAFSGKDASKVDRSGAYLARYIAKNIVGAGLAEKCEVALTYAIGVSKPTNIDINTFYTGAYNEHLIKQAVEKVFDLSVSGTIEKLGLQDPIFTTTAKAGHFGDDRYAWEKLDKAEELKKAILE